MEFEFNRFKNVLAAQARANVKMIPIMGETDCRILKVLTCTVQGLREGGSGGTSYPGPGLGGPEEFRFPR